MCPDFGWGRVPAPPSRYEPDLGHCSRRFGTGFSPSRPLFGGRKEKQENATSSRSAEGRFGTLVETGLCGDFTHPRVVQAERLACRERQPTQFPGGSPDPLCGQGPKAGKRNATLPITSIAMPLTRRSFSGSSGERTNTTITPVWPCEALCAPIADGQNPYPSQTSPGQRGPLFPAVLEGDFLPPGPFTEDERYSRIKAGVAVGASGRSRLPAVRAVTGSFRCIKSGVKIRAVLSFLGSRFPNSYCRNKKQGSIKSPPP